MKNQTFVLVRVLGVAALVAGLSVAALAADPPAPAPVLGDSPRELWARIAEKLDLNPAQQKKLEELRGQRRAELEALRDDQTLAPDARREKARSILENYRPQLAAVLTPAQQEKMAALRANREAGLAPRGPGENFDRGPGPALSPPGRLNPLAIVALGERIKDRMAEKLGLTDAQRDQLEHLGRAYRAQQRALTKKHLEEMRGVLTPEQRQQAEEMRRSYRHGRPGGPRPPRLGRDDGPDGPLVAGADFEPGDRPDDQADERPAPDLN
ncbi:MAG: Spy/CpxP family protein refolding chaperone [Opitutae bacterium]|nr:Spy/CpxP family protein refolding chaperone [Opitutae bacterium]